MSGTGSPADQQDQVIETVDTGAPAGATVDSGEGTPASGDANLSDGASSATVDPGAKKDAVKPTLADVLKDAAKLDDTGKSPVPAKTESVVDGAAPEKHDPKDDEKLPFHTHPRWKEVTGQNKQLTAEVETLRPAAEQYGNITSYMEKHNLNHDEVGEGFIIMAMMKAGDPRVLQKLDEARAKVAAALGETIPKDIQDQIDSGAISEEAGRELSKTRARAAKSDADAAALRTASETRTANENAAALRQSFAATANAWEVETRKADPDFAKKERQIERYSQAIMHERGFPKTPADALAIVKEAYEAVNKDLGVFVPAKQPVARVNVAPSSHGAGTKPKTLSEAVRKAAAL